MSGSGTNMKQPRARVISAMSLAAAALGCLTSVALQAGNWSWRQRSTNAPPTVAYHTRVSWTGWELLTWGTQLNTDGRYVPVGWRWNPRGGTIRSLPTEGAPPWPDGQSVVWAGRYLAVWGGRRNSDPTSDTNAGYLYDPAHDRWIPMSTVNAPTRRADHGAIWSGHEMFVWGGSHVRQDGTGYEITFPEDFGAYDPETDTWRRFTPLDGPAGRDQPCLTWTGTEMLLWGGTRLAGGWDDLHFVYYSELFRFDPTTQLWTQSLTPGAPSGRADTGSVWTGSEWIIWGGYNGRTYAGRNILGDGARYTPALDRWVPVNPEHPLGARERPIAVWNGTEVIFWCGERQPSVGARYDPLQDAWSALPAENAPPSTEAGNAIWNGESLLAVGDDVFALDPESAYRDDLLPNDWQETYFGSHNPLATPDGDADGDAWINRHEWLYHTNPVDAQSHPEFHTSLTPSHVRVSIQEADPFLRYSLSVAEDLWTWIDSGPSDPQRLDHQLVWEWPRPTGPIEFRRLRVSDPTF
jgi:hypothetical protein